MLMKAKKFAEKARGDESTHRNNIHHQANKYKWSLQEQRNCDNSNSSTAPLDNNGSTECHYSEEGTRRISLRKFNIIINYNISFI